MAKGTVKCPYCGAGFQGTQVSGRHIRSCKKKNKAGVPTTTTGAGPTGYSDSAGDSVNTYQDMYRKYRPTETGDWADPLPKKPSKWTQWKRARGLQTRSASRPAVKVTRFTHRGVDYTIEQHPRPVPIAMSWHSPNNVDYAAKDRRGPLVLMTEPGVRRLSEHRWVAARGHYGTTEGGDADFAGNTKAEVESAIRKWIDEVERPL